MILFTLSFMCFKNSPAFADSNENIILKTGYLYLISFDNTVKQYNINNSHDYNIELPSNIYNEKTEVIIKPKKNINTMLKIQTSSDNYNFNITVNQQTSLSSKAGFKLACTVQPMDSAKRDLKTAASNFYVLEIDKPPVISTKQYHNCNFEINKPPCLLTKRIESYCFDIDKPPKM